MAAQTAARTARHARRKHQSPVLAARAVTFEDETAGVRPRAARRVDQGGTLPDVDDGSSSEPESPTAVRARCMPVVVTRSVTATAVPATRTPTSSWLERTRLFGGMTLGLISTRRAHRCTIYDTIRWRTGQSTAGG